MQEQLKTSTDLSEAETIERLGREEVMEVLEKKLWALDWLLELQESVRDELVSSRFIQSLTERLQMRGVEFSDAVVQADTTSGAYVAEITEYIRSLRRQKLNVTRALNEARGIKPEPSEEAFKDRLYRAKEYPIESIYRGSLRKFGKNQMGVCPFHEEDTPSFIVYPTNTYHCFGCNKSGDSISLYQHLNSVSFKEAVDILSK